MPVPPQAVMVGNRGNSVFMHGTNVVAGVDLEADENTGKPLKCTSLGDGDKVFSKETLKALQAAGQLPPVQQQDYEARLLANELVSFQAVWLHGKSNDFIIPLPPTYDRMNAYQPYSESQVWHQNSRAGSKAGQRDVGQAR